MMKKLVLGMSLIVGLSSVGQARASFLKKGAILIVGVVAGAVLQKCYTDREEQEKQKLVSSINEDGAILKQS